MAETEAPPDAPETGNEPESETPPEKKTPDVDWKAKAREWEKRAKDNSAAATELAELKEKQKTDEQRLVERAEKAESELPTLQAENLRLRVAIAKSLPADLVDRLRGDTEEDLIADADKLLDLVGDGKPTTPKPDRTQGAKGDAPEETDPAKLAAMVPRNVW